MLLVSWLEGNKTKKKKKRNHDNRSKLPQWRHRHPEVHGFCVHAGQQAESVKFSRLDLASRQCVKITWSLAAPSPRRRGPRLSPLFSANGELHSNATWSRGENSNSWWKERGFLLLLFEGAIECVSRGIDSRLFRVQRRMWSCYLILVRNEKGERLIFEFYKVIGDWVMVMELNSND